MKITKSLRIFLVLLSVMMVLPLFACGETPEETTTKAPEATTAPGEKETTAEKTDDTTEPKAPATTVADDDDDDTTEAPATTVADDTAETTAEETTETETETATESDGESDTTETTAEETTTACAHASVTYNDNCDAICSSCGEILATEVHPDHAETYVDENGVRTYTVKCAVCDKPLYEYTMQLGEIAPELIITADKLSLMVKATGENISAEMAEDGSYVTLHNTPGIKDEGCFTAYVGDGSVTGQYMLIKYRTTGTIPQQIWVGANNGNDEPSKGDSFYLKTLENNSMAGFVSDGEWRVTVIDLAAVKAGKFNAETEGENEGKYCADYIKWDVFDMGTKNAETVDVAYVALADDLGELLAVNNVREYTYVQKLLSNYAIAEPMNALTNNPYFDPEFLNIRVGNESIASVKKDETNNGLPYIELISNSDTGEQKFFVWEDYVYTVKDSGNYLGVLYRRSVTADTFEIFINSNNAGPNRVSSKASITTIADGTWQLRLIDISGLNNPENEAYYDPAMGISVLRFDYFNGNRTIGETLDIAFIATFDDEAQAAKVFSDYFQRYFNGGAQICKHTSVENVSYVSDDDENTVLALEKFDCLVCGQKGLVRKAAYGAALETVDANTLLSFSTALLKVENCVTGVWKSGGKAYPSVGYVTPSAEGTVTANGWCGVNGDLLIGEGLYGAAYMIVDAEGNVLQTWTETDANFAGEKADITNAINLMGHGIAPVGRRFSIAADVSAFAGQTVNVIYAVIPANIPEGSNDKYVPIIEIQGIKVPAAE